MLTNYRTFICVASLAFLAVGCQNQSDPVASSSETPAAHSEVAGHEHEGHTDADLETAMAELNPEDRTEAEAQKFCAVMNTSLLGSMGPPLKLDVKGQPVFVCCDGCKSKAMKNADQTLATVSKLKAENTNRSK